MFTVEIKKSANKFFKKLPGDIAGHLRGAVSELAKSQNPETNGIQLVGINPKAFRVRVGMYRIIYRVDFKNSLIMIYKIGHRKDVYKS